MKTKALSLLASVALLCLVSCTDEAQELANESSPVLKQIVMTTQDFQPESGSRTLYGIGEAIKCTWAENDTVGVFPEEGAQAYFPMASGAGTKNATFDGEGWALKDGFTYASYYPYIGNAYLNRNAVPVDYTGQTQTGNASVAHLGAYDYMWAAPTTSEFGSAQFTFKHLSAMVQLRLTVPQPATLTSVKLVAESDAFAVEGKVDIMADAPSITSVKASNEIVLNLQDVTTTEENQVVTFYLMLPPADLSEQGLKAMVASDKGTQEVALEGGNFKAGTAYGLSGEMVSTEAGYKNGVISLSEAGTMTQLLGDDLLTITSLKVVGPINGDDVLCLRQMLGGSEFSDTEKGKLVSLDLSEASIVEGGEWYYQDASSGHYYFTSDDAVGSYMFYECANLQDMELPGNVTSIGIRAFYNCKVMASMEIPDGVTSIGEYAISGCRALTSIDIPDDVTSIKQGTFSSCTSLVSVTIGDKVTSIDQYAFVNCSSLTSVNIGDGVVSIGDYAFRYCSSLTSINIPDGVTSIGQEAFYNCTSLTSATIGGVVSIGYEAFWNCKSLTSVTLGDSVVSIGDSAFSYCESLTSIDIPDGVTSIGRYAFSYCSSLIDIYCRATTPPEIGSDAFPKYGDKISLHVPSGCLSAYQSSSWASYFKTIKEME